jgi:hypothetical protein
MASVMRRPANDDPAGRPCLGIDAVVKRAKFHELSFVDCDSKPIYFPTTFLHAIRFVKYSTNQP